MNSNEVRRVWEDRTGEYSPAYYAYYGPDATSSAIRRVLERFVGRDAAVLELGCSSGRHLSHLFEHGFDDLTGIDVNADAYDVMSEHYPELARHGTFHLDAIEDAVPGFDADRFDAVYSVETLQHLHGDAEWVFEELGRITAELLVTVENEGEPEGSAHPDGTDVSYVHEDLPLYHRDWHEVFTDCGFDEVSVDSLVTDSSGNERTEGDGSAVGRGTVRAFRTA